MEEEAPEAGAGGGAGGEELEDEVVGGKGGVCHWGVGGQEE